ncbi:hypothetical protein E3T26_00530 [Cryobacterium sp. TMT1-21]|uniref:CoA-transferase n=1 Tax=unclassified Cryobacterium TaxID=2649013 RepID=UPI00106B38C1|nr:MULTISPECIES: CoA-transferase [unclassified Cryobacterium]TFD17972.1 hypothetical protein E3T42_06725 [Cryobacterium sp. TMT4-10]TFD18140.1 hypothetical protein E3T26_00530 [Cryobacterium sp. TMT1-21]TFD40064.1 hypothetical protein E3T37_06660 [Cryobacterium sp. TMT2-10]
MSGKPAHTTAADGLSAPVAVDNRSVAARLFAILDAFTAPAGATSLTLTLTAIAQRAGLPLSTTHRLVAEWVGWGGLTKHDNGQYSLGMKLWGLPWRYGPDGEVTVSSPPKQTRTFSSLRGGEKEYVLEEAIVTDYTLGRAAKGDRHGNLVFEKSARNFNPVAGMAGRITIAEVDELVEPGEIDPDQVHLAGIYVNRIVQLGAVDAADLPIEKTTTRPRPSASAVAHSPPDETGAN